MAIVRRILISIARPVVQEHRYESNDSWGMRSDEQTVRTFTVLKSKAAGDAKAEYWEKPRESFPGHTQCEELVKLLRTAPVLSEGRFTGQIGFGVDLFDVINWSGGNEVELPVGLQERLRQQLYSPEWASLAGQEVILEWSTDGSWNRGELPRVLRRGQITRWFDYPVDGYASAPERKEAPAELGWDAPARPVAAPAPAEPEEPALSFTLADLAGKFGKRH